MLRLLEQKHAHPLTPQVDFSDFDRMHAAHRAGQPLEYGRFDYNRLEAP